MNIGSFLGINGALTNWTMGIHLFVAGVYNDIISFAGSTGNATVDGIITDFRNNLYILIGIFMVFRLGISLINYLINPDAVTDKQAGAGKMITRIITSFILLLAMPWVFNKLTDLENAILSNGGALDQIMHLVSVDKNTAINQTIIVDDVNAEEIKKCNMSKIKYTPESTEINLSTMEGCAFDKNEFLEKIKEIYYLGYLNIEMQKYQEDFLLGVAQGDQPTIESVKKKYPLVACEGNRQGQCYDIKYEYETSAKYEQKDVLLYGDISVAPGKIHGTIKLSKQREIKDDESNKLVCYYYNNGLEGGIQTIGSRIVKLVFTQKEQGVKINNYDWYISVDTTSENDINFATLNFDKARTQNGELPIIKLIDGTCPPAITNVKCDENNNSCKNSNTNIVIREKEANSSKWNNLTGGVQSLDELLNLMSQEKNKKNLVYSDNLPESIKLKLDEITATIGLTCDNDAGCSFSRQLMEAFVTYSDEQKPAVDAHNEKLSELRKQRADNKITETEYANQLVEIQTNSPKLFDKWPHNNKEIEDSVEREEYNFNFLLSLILGIGVLVFLLAMGIEIVIRSFKLIILQMLAPVPIIMYMNPNDKMFDGWVKQYAGTFLDLFIKLLGIKLVSILLASAVPSLIAEAGSGFFVTIAYIMAAVLFMKIAPDFISKILGVKDMAGSMKDTFGMMKKGLFATTGGAVAAGAIAGNAVRNAYNAHKGGLGAKGAWAAAGRALLGAPGAILRGAGGGWKGNVMSGAQGAWAKGTARSDLYRQGVGAGTQMTAGLLGSMGLDYATRKDKDLEKTKAEQAALERAQKYKDNIQNIGMNESNFGSDILNKKDVNGNYVYSKDQRKTAAKAWASAQYEAHNNGADFQKYCKDNGLTGTSKEEQKAYKDAYISEKLSSDSNLNFMTKEDRERATYEGGKAAAITGNVNDAQSFTKLEIEGVTRDEKGGRINVSGVEGVYDLEDKATKKHTANSNTINKQTVNDPKYVDAAAARDAVKKGKN